MNARLGDADLRSMADRCVQCGLCLPQCPTYLDQQIETESPRGRIVLAKALATGTELSDSDLGTFDHCLGCRRCEAICPASVPFDRILVEGRARIYRRRRTPLKARLLLWLIRHPRLLRFSLGLALRLPVWGRLRPVGGPRAQTGWHRSQKATSRGRLLLYPGCIAGQLDVNVHTAAVKVLTERGWDVWLPRTLPCCGSLHDHAGRPEQGQQLRQQLARATADGRFDAAIGCASGCIESLQRALDPLPCFEIMSFLDHQQAPAVARPAGQNPTSSLLHVPCSQRNVLQQPEAAGNQLRAANHAVSEAPAVCCGAGGWNSWLFPEQGQRLVAPLKTWIEKQAGRRVLSQNIGCRLHLCKQLGAHYQILHPIELLASSEAQTAASPHAQQSPPAPTHSHRSLAD